ncbi:hypothetical protein ACFL0F_01950, partial [Patescibacteria group bacterium]
MTDKSKIKCPECGTLFEPSEAFKHQVEEEALENLLKQHNEELEKVKKEAEQKVQVKLSRDLKDKDSQIGELKKRAEKAEEEELKIRKERRELKEAKEKFELEKERELDEEREKIKKAAADEIQEKDRLKFAEYEKKIADMNKVIKELER